MQPNQQQLNYINAADDRIVLSAVPGSGKTHSVALRIEHEINVLKLDPTRIVCLSYTLAGAEAIRSRLQGKGITIGFCGTIDAFCKQLLERMGRSLGYRDEITVDEDAAMRILHEKLALGSRPKKESSMVYSILGIDPLNMNTPTSIVARAVLMEMRRRSIGTFQSIKREVIRILQNNRDTLKLEALHVDEAQDMNHDDWSIIDAINPAIQSIVGDEDQSLYEFRGAVPELFVAEGGTRMSLTTNYRSARDIVEASNRLIAHNQQRSPKAGVAASQEQGILRILPKVPTRDLASIIHGLQSANASLAVLFRYNREADLLREELKRHSNAVKTNVHIGTIHSSKGLEFDRVILNDWEPKTVDEEERRLFYVAMTRAKSQIAIITERQSPFTREAGL